MAELSDPDLVDPNLEWRDEIPFSTDFDDVYFSRGGGSAETQHVFLAGNDLPRRWQGRPCFVIAETGFGSGLNFIEAWRAWQQDPERCHRLHFLSVEGRPLAREQLAMAGRRHEARDLYDQLVAEYPVRCPGFHRVELEAGRVVLTLLFGEAQTVLSRVANGEDRTVDAWFLDGFTPARNPEMWTDELFREVARLSRDDATLSTYTSAGFVRRGLEQVGFSIEKRPGFGTKREMTCGQYQGSRAPDRTLRPWQRWPRPPTERTTLVIGGGLAGTAIAGALSRRGFGVTLLERHGTLAAEASGNPAGIYHADLMRECTLRERWITGAAGFSARHRKRFADRIAENECGVLHPAVTPKRRTRHEEIRERRNPFPEFARWLDPGEASEIAGIPLDHAALFYPQGGWVCPGELCRANVETGDAITVRTNAAVADLQRSGGRWIALDANGETLAEAATAVVATAGDASRLPILDWLPLRRLRGQITLIECTPGSAALRSVVYYGGYVTPVHEGRHTIGATFDPHSADPVVREEDHTTNLDRLAEGFPALHATLVPATETRTGRAAIRGVTPDHLPMIGPVPDEARFREQFDGLRFGRAIDEATIAPYLPGLYLSVGHGSRGIISSQFGAELLASQIAGDPLPTERAVAGALGPSRFLVRALLRRSEEDR